MEKFILFYVVKLINLFFMFSVFLDLLRRYFLQCYQTIVFYFSTLIV